MRRDEKHLLLADLPDSPGEVFASHTAISPHTFTAMGSDSWDEVAKGLGRVVRTDLVGELGNLMGWIALETVLQASS